MTEEELRNINICPELTDEELLELQLSRGYNVPKVSMDELVREPERISLREIMCSTKLQEAAKTFILPDEYMKSLIPYTQEELVEPNFVVESRECQPK
jgi:hypothetical protein